MTDTRDPPTPSGGAPATPPGSGPSASDEAEFQQYVAIWMKAVDTQMHFNEMSVKSRQLGLTFVAAALGVAVVLISRDKDYSISVFEWFEIHVAVLLVLAGAGAISVVRILDLGVYHRMLRGAVAFGEELEETKIKPRLSTQHGMTQAISLFSRYPNAKFDVGATPRYSDDGKKKTAEQKIKGFYLWTTLGLIGAAALLFIVTCSPRAAAPAEERNAGDRAAER